jgi:hypothetical protein
MDFLITFAGVVLLDRQKFTSDFFCFAVTVKVMVLYLIGFLFFLALGFGIGVIAR